MVRPDHESSAGMPTGLFTAVSRVASEEAERWFPELDVGSVAVRVLGSQARARCFLHQVLLEDGATSRLVMVKVRHSEPGLRRIDRFESRPVLTPERTLSDPESAQREYEGLREIALAFAGVDPTRFGVLRPLALLRDHSALVMDVVQEPTLRTRLTSTSRLRLLGGGDRSLDETPWRNAGAWLRRFHDRAGVGDELPARISTRDDVADLYRSMAGFLLERLGHVPVLQRVRADADDIAGVLPGELPLAPGHGDFVANNMFASRTGRLTVFDPLVRWRVPVYHDLATLTVGLRALPIVASTQGAVFPPERLSRYETAVVQGYCGDDHMPVAPLLAYRLLVLLDRWSALASKVPQGGGMRRGVRGVRVRLSSRYFGRMAAETLDQLA